MNKLKSTLYKINKYNTFWIILFEVLIAYFLYYNGFRITYSPGLENNWEAIGAVGQWAGAFVSILIPIAAVYLQSSIDKNKEDIGESNQQLLKDFEDFKTEYSDKFKILSKHINENGDIHFDGGDFNDNSKEYQKEKALKFVNISMITNTKKVAKHLGIEDGEAYDLLEEMLRHDELISSGGAISKGNMQNIMWTKKKK